MTGPIRQRKDRRALDEFYRLGPGVSTKVSKEMIVGHMAWYHGPEEGWI